MPTLLTRRKAKRPLPPCGRRNEYNEPHSPFQKLIDGERVKRDLSFRDLAGMISDASGVKVHPATFWIWLHNKNGFPHPKSFKPQHLAALAKVLKIEQTAIKQALDASRHIYTAKENPVPQESYDGLATLIDTLKNIKKRHVTTSWVLNLAQRLQSGATAAGRPPAPKS